MRRRSGSTLLETAIFIPISFALLIGAFGLMHKVMIVANLAKNQSAARRTIGSLALQFRNDVRASNAAKLEKSNNYDRLVLKRADESSIVYEVGSSVIRRTDTSAGHEQYLIPEERKASFEIYDANDQGSSSTRRQIRLRVIRSSKVDAGSSILDVEIEAALGARAGSIERVSQ